MRIGEVLRYGRPYAPEPASLDGFPNFFFATRPTTGRLSLLEHGINPIAAVSAPEGPRCPAILISSSPHKVGSISTPWQDMFDPDNGRIRYFGDNKSHQTAPSDTQGNRVLLRAYEIHSSPAPGIRRESVPILFFERVSQLGRQKGFVRFQGLGVIERVELVTQHAPDSAVGFSNFAFDMAILSLAEENEDLDWRWINERRTPGTPVEQTEKHAPASWKEVVRRGSTSIDRLRRHVSSLLVTPANDQRPANGSREERVLHNIYGFYSKSAATKVRFEALAATVAEQILGKRGAYRQGWITPGSSDRGVDFVGRLDVGDGFAKAKVIVLGQAKCERVDVATGGNHIARTVARLRRGWIGVYVTTSYFSEAVQAEVIEDQYPLVLVNGLRVAQEVMRIGFLAGETSATSTLERIDSLYQGMVQTRHPEEILLS